MEVQGMKIKRKFIRLTIVAFTVLISDNDDWQVISPWI
jgi:hypothetical protein